MPAADPHQSKTNCRDGSQRARLDSSKNLTVRSSTRFGEGNALSRPKLFCCTYTTQSLSECEPNSGAAQISLLLKRASKLLTVVPLGTSAQGRDCHTNRRHTGCSVTAYDFTQQKKLLLPQRKYQRKKRKYIESQASHRCCAESKEESSYDRGTGKFKKNMPI